MSKLGDRFKVIGTNYKMASQHDPKLGWVLAGLFVAVLGTFVAAGLIFGNMATWVLIGLPLAILIVTIVFSRRALRSAYRSLEGKQGAAVAVIQSQSLAKAGWTVTPGVAVNKAQDMVHRAVGRGGIVLIGEGTSPALASLMAGERKRTARFVGEIPISEIVIGQGEDQIRIAKLESYLRKLNKVLAPGEVTELRKRLVALTNSPLPIPKGPIPKSTRAVPRGRMR